MGVVMNRHIVSDLAFSSVAPREVSSMPVLIEMKTIISSLKRFTTHNFRRPLAWVNAWPSRRSACANERTRRRFPLMGLCSSQKEA
jgi:hypothetical protein